MIAIFGPTAVGKTAVAVALADLLRERGQDPVAISADALAVYEGLETITAAPTGEERARLEHRLVGTIPVTRPFSVGEFMPMAHAEIDSALETGRRPIVVGGTGLYLRAALTSLDLKPPPDPGVRERLLEELEAAGPEALHRRLRERAPAVAAEIEPGDRTRVVRSLELLEMGEEVEPAPGESQLWTSDTRHPTALFGLVMEREALYERVNARVDAMIAAGAIDEVKRAYAAGASPTARKAHGFEDLLAGDVDAMKRRIRQFTRRQLTWMRKLPDVRTIDVTGRAPADVAVEIASEV